MALRNRYLTFNGTNLKTAYGLKYSDFKEELPEPKVFKVDIPAGSDLDITDSLGRVGFHNGKHTLKFLLYGDTQTERLEKKRELISKLHGVKANYVLSWDSGYTYNGRAKVSVDHKFDNADVVTIEIDRGPWKTHSQESVVLNAHPSASYTLTGSSRFHNVKAKLLQDGTTKIGSDAVVDRAAGTYTLKTDVYGNTTVVVTVDDWLMYVDGTNLVVNPVHVDQAIKEGFGIDSPYTITNGNMVFSEEAKQYVTIYFTRMDH